MRARTWEARLATENEVEQVLADLVARLGRVDPATRAMLPGRRTIEARCPDLDLVVHAEWNGGHIQILDGGLDRRADIRISVRSDDLVAMANGELPFARAYASNRIRVDASMTDLLRLRAAL